MTVLWTAWIFNDHSQANIDDGNQMLLINAIRAFNTLALSFMKM